MSGQAYDVVVVGAGPAGSYIAYELASSGHNVAVLEEKRESGLNVCCTGIVSIECFNSLSVNRELILAGVNSVRFFSPSGKCLRLQTQEVQAYVIDRPLLDKALAARAQSQGARYFFSSLVMSIIPGKDVMQVETLCSGARQVFSAKSVVLANGFKHRLCRELGMGRIKHFLVGAQTEVEANNVDEFEVYFGREVAPGAFAWLVPTSANRAYIGLLATSQAKLHLQKFLEKLFYQNRIISRGVEIRQKTIPVGTLPRSYGDRVLVIGDAAGHVKPTTGGGIYFGHLGAEIAAGVLGEALLSGNLAAGHLSLYQKRWRAKMGKELSRGYWARQAYTKLSDRQIERVFELLDSNGMAEALLNSGNFSFDWHSRLILTLLGQMSAYRVLRIKHLLSREASS